MFYLSWIAIFMLSDSASLQKVWDSDILSRPKVYCQYLDRLMFCWFPLFTECGINITRYIKTISSGKTNVANQTYNEKASIRFFYFVSSNFIFLVISEWLHYDSQHFENRMKLFNCPTSSGVNEWASERTSKHSGARDQSKQVG